MIFKEPSILNEVTSIENKIKYITIKVPLKQMGGISIRQYAAEKGKPDFIHITANGRPVIPGTSFAGAIRHRIENILDSLNVQNVEDILDKMFGYVNAKRVDNKAERSKVIINECILEGAKPITMTRNGISRFESGSKVGALFKEITYVNGNTILEIKVENIKDTEAFIGFLILALKDLEVGYLAVGGQTAIGRGIFQKNGELSVYGIDYSEDRCLKNAFAMLELKGESR